MSYCRSKQENVTSGIFETSVRYENMLKRYSSTFEKTNKWKLESNRSHKKRQMFDQKPPNIRRHREAQTKANPSQKSRIQCLQFLKTTSLPNKLDEIFVQTK
jgi:hypothetical protein